MLDIAAVKLTLFTGPDCHLCDLALQVMEASACRSQFEYDKVNIRTSTELYHLYAVRIPVVKRSDNGAELGWPFDVTAFEEFIQ